MAKRYHQSVKDRMSESRGEERYRMRAEMANHRADRFNDEHHHSKDRSQTKLDRMSSLDMYAGMEPRRRQEMEDAGMLHEDHSQIANLPQNVMIKAYPRTGSYLPEVLNDTVEGVDHQMDYDDSKRAEHFYPKKV